MVSLPHLNVLIPEKDIISPAFQSLSLGETVCCEIIFGSPSMNCRGTGICKITSTEELTSLSCARFRAHITLRRDGHGLLVFFSKDQLADAAFSRHFPEDKLVMNEPCVVPEFIRTSLNTDIQYISAGRYQLQAEGTYVFISVDVCRG